jgi:hypothetical protein
VAKFLNKSTHQLSPLPDPNSTQEGTAFGLAGYDLVFRAICIKGPISDTRLAVMEYNVTFTNVLKSLILSPGHKVNRPA